MFERLFKFSALSCAIIKGLCWSQALVQQPRRSLLYSELPRKGLCFYGAILSDMQTCFFYLLSSQMLSALMSQESQSFAIELIVSTIGLLWNMTAKR